MFSTVLIACIDGPFGVNARYLCDMTWLMLIGTMCLLFVWNTDARENGRRWLTVVIVACLSSASACSCYGL